MLVLFDMVSCVIDEIDAIGFYRQFFTVSSGRLAAITKQKIKKRVNVYLLHYFSIEGMDNLWRLFFLFLLFLLFHPFNSLPPICELQKQFAINKRTSSL